jgi:glycerol kinase
MKPVLAIDIGTSSIKAILLGSDGQLINEEEILLSPYHPNHGQIEHRPEELFELTLDVIDQVLTKASILKSDLSSIGICNAKGTTIVWDKKTKKPIWNAISFADDRKYDGVDQYQTKHSMIKDKTGRFLNTHSPVLKLKWILEKTGACPDNLLCGSLSTWILWKLTNGKLHITDTTNAAMTFLFNIHTLDWDAELLRLFDIPRNMLPTVKSCSEIYGETDQTIFDASVPVAAMIGKTQSALFGSGCTKSGDVHCFLGSGSFLQAHTGSECVMQNKTLTSTIALSLKNEPITYCLEGSIHSSGGVIDWLKDHLGLIRSINEIEGLAYSVPDSLGVYFIPALNGIGFSKSGASIRGSFLGLSCNTNIGHICRASLEGIALMLGELFLDMKSDLKNDPSSIKCTGGMAENNFLMQMCSDILNTPIVRSENIQMASVGVAFLAGLATNVWSSPEEIHSLFKKERTFSPELDKTDQDRMKKDFKRALKSTITFSDIEVA